MKRLQVFEIVCIQQTVRCNWNTRDVRSQATCCSALKWYPKWFQSYHVDKHRQTLVKTIPPRRIAPRLRLIFPIKKVSNNGRSAFYRNNVWKLTAVDCRADLQKCTNCCKLMAQLIIAGRLVTRRDNQARSASWTA